MKKYIFFLFALLQTSLFANTYNVVSNNSNNFVPNTLIINIGDTVIWNNIGGFHNVNGTLASYPLNPEGFGNSVSSSAWTFQHVFTIPGIYVYQCDPHLVMAMVGVIQVGEATNIDEIKQQAALKKSSFIFLNCSASPPLSG